MGQSAFNNLRDLLGMQVQDIVWLDVKPDLFGGRQVALSKQDGIQRTHRGSGNHRDMGSNTKFLQRLPYADLVSPFSATTRQNQAKLLSYFSPPGLEPCGTA